MLVILNEENVPIERFVFEVDLGPEEDFGKVKGKTYTLQDLEKDFQAFLLKINVVESFQPHTRGMKYLLSFLPFFSLSLLTTIIFRTEVFLECHGCHKRNHRWRR